MHRLNNLSDNLGQQWLLRCIRAAKRITTKKASIHLQWAPGHNDVKGNEKADTLAKEAAKERPTTSTIASLAYLGTEINKIQKTEQLMEYKRYTDRPTKNRSSYSRIFKLNTHTTIKVPKGTPREISSAFYSLKLGHGYFNSYLKRFNKRDCNLSCKTAFDLSFTPANICSAFRGAGLVPVQPDTFLSKLDVQLRTPTPLATIAEVLWQTCTPSNTRELEAQSTLIRDRVQRHQGSSPASIIAAISQLQKGAEVMILSAELMRDRIASLERANIAVSERRKRKKKRIQKRGVLTKGAGEDIIAQREADEQIACEERQGGKRSGV
ncbi:hypothetical protein PtrM4_142860 [Pyrenophora tritici-repentis]|uniref:RNase H type-1 domain-containing protein n=1 Tax=Pyrenophora tritici-repentis TaxID=45151 RepID=A0A834RP11_9PLEO|nr:hypothetical protein PtrM4_142860 [Pyrenophora tritici-repentis]